SSGDQSDDEDIDEGGDRLHLAEGDVKSSEDARSTQGRMQRLPCLPGTGAAISTSHTVELTRRARYKPWLLSRGRLTASASRHAALSCYDVSSRPYHACTRTQLVSQHPPSSALLCTLPISGPQVAS